MFRSNAKIPRGKGGGKMYFDPQPIEAHKWRDDVQYVANAGVSGTSLVFTRRTTRTASFLIRS